MFQPHAYAIYSNTVIIPHRSVHFLLEPLQIPLPVSRRRDFTFAIYLGTLFTPFFLQNLDIRK